MKVLNSFTLMGREESYLAGGPEEQKRGKLTTKKRNKRLEEKKLLGEKTLSLVNFEIGGRKKMSTPDRRESSYWKRPTVLAFESTPLLKRHKWLEKWRGVIRALGEGLFKEKILFKLARDRRRCNYKEKAAPRQIKNVPLLYTKKERVSDAQNSRKGTEDVKGDPLDGEKRTLLKLIGAIEERSEKQPPGRGKASEKKKISVRPSFRACWPGTPRATKKRERTLGTGKKRS